MSQIDPTIITQPAKEPDEAQVSEATRLAMALNLLLTHAATEGVELELPDISDEKANKRIERSLDRLTQMELVKNTEKGKTLQARMRGEEPADDDSGEISDVDIDTSKIVADAATMTLVEARQIVATYSAAFHDSERTRIERRKEIAARAAALQASKRS